MDEKTKDLIIPGLIDVAFFGNYDIDERNAALDIIGMLEVRDEVIEVALDYLYDCLNSNPDDFPTKKIVFKGPDVCEAAKWIARDPKLKVELEENIENLMKDADYSEQVVLYKEILKQINE